MSALFAVLATRAHATSKAARAAEPPRPARPERPAPEPRAQRRRLHVPRLTRGAPAR